MKVRKTYSRNFDNFDPYNHDFNKGVRMIDKIRQVFNEVAQIDRDRLTLNARLKDDLLLDSLTTLELILELEGEFDIQFQNEELGILKTFQDVVFAVESKTKS